MECYLLVECYVFTLECHKVKIHEQNNFNITKTDNIIKFVEADEHNSLLTYFAVPTYCHTV